MSEPLCKRVFVIGLDGAIGRSVRDANTPRIDAVIAGGVWTYAGRTVYPSASFQAWGAMFHGVGPEKHGIDGDHPCEDGVPWPSFARVLCQQRPASRCAAFSCWEPVNSRIIEPSLDCHRISLPDPELVREAVQYIRREPPDLLFLHLDFIDGAGHAHGYGSPAYLEQISATDRQVGEVIDAISAAGVLEESLIVLLSDHGGTGNSHGGDHPDCMTIFWACRGPGVARGMELADGLGIAATAPIIARALGLAAPEGWDARVPEGIFSV